ncbi:MAG: putative DNA-binding protein [Defluviitaleaceae bacterium]|nr:putative DNA-binding protein [Defluviitaleaceae bacterium]
MDKRLYITMLYDFYGELLTEKQKTFFEMYYHNDMSLREIAEVSNITPQAVSDLIKRVEKIIISYEDRLKLVDKFAKQKLTLTKIYQSLDTHENISKIKEMIEELLE